MKTSLFSFAAALALLVTTGSFSASAADLPDNNRREAARRDDRYDKDFNYGYDRRHKVTATERARWEAAQRQEANYRAAQQAAAQRNRQDAQRQADRRNDRYDKDFNYGYDRNHRVSAAERARWEAAHRSNQRDGRR
ncbi:hypothetical protein [Hymenobacter sp. BT730]|uniref:hypothetical protein n=1 Tax=Hymenobacter sp. BT730 TaxID=3063332 RepID=UPI0026DFF426|nr:hypothetical protein [Hymenobacter sp. BT730]